MNTLIHPVPTAAMDRIIEMALAEDNPRGDLTALTIVYVAAQLGYLLWKWRNERAERIAKQAACEVAQ